MSFRAMYLSDLAAGRDGREYAERLTPEPSAKAVFDLHLDRCRQCADHPFALCAHGAYLLARAVAEQTDGQ